MRYILVVTLLLLTISCTKGKKNKLLGSWHTSTTSCSDFKSGIKVTESNNAIEFTEKKMKVSRRLDSCEQVIEYDVEYKDSNAILTTKPALIKKCKEVDLSSSESQFFDYVLEKDYVILNSKSVFGGCSILIKKK